MTFLIHTTDDGRSIPWEYLPVKAITPKVGLALALDAATGQLEVSQTPQYICMAEFSQAVEAGVVIPVIKIQPDVVFESALDGDAAFKIGELADVTADGLQISSGAASNSNFLIEYMDGQAAGDIVRGRFVK